MELYDLSCMSLKIDNLKEIKKNQKGDQNLKSLYSTKGRFWQKIFSALATKYVTCNIKTF